MSEPYMVNTSHTACGVSSQTTLLFGTFDVLHC